MIDNLTAEHVDWNPYKSDVSQEFPHTLFEGMIRCHNIIEPYMPQRDLYQMDIMYFFKHLIVSGLMTNRIG
ncbi:hypothetical protein Leryth_018710 [Lithospermum erythrorhizon]|nr:hypothetical protein Leryth_018710 [Lithospermum erythrorhizon]